MEFANEGEGAFKAAVAALRVALESKDTVAVDPLTGVSFRKRRSMTRLKRFRILNLATTILLAIHPRRCCISNHHQRNPSIMRSRRPSRVTTCASIMVFPRRPSGDYWITIRRMPLLVSRAFLTW